MSDSFESLQRVGLEAAALQVAMEVAALPVPVLRELAPLLAQAELETARGLRSWLALGKGDARFTAYEYSRAMTQLRVAMDTLARIEPTLTRALSQGSHRAGMLASQHTTGIINRNFARFGAPLEAPIRLDLARILAMGQGLIPQFASSAARYSESVQAEIRKQLSIALLRGETTGAMIERLAARANIARAAGAEPTAADAAKGLLYGATWQLERLVRTEMAHASDIQAHQAFRQALAQVPGLRRQWNAALDLRICGRCKEMHGAVSGPDGAFSSLLPGPPLHPN